MICNTAILFPHFERYIYAYSRPTRHYKRCDSPAVLSGYGSTCQLTASLAALARRYTPEGQNGWQSRRRCHPSTRSMSSLSSTFSSRELYLIRKEAALVQQTYMSRRMALWPSQCWRTSNDEIAINGAELQNFLYALQWMCTAVRQFMSVVQNIQDFIENIYEKAGKQTQQSMAHIQPVERNTQRFTSWFTTCIGKSDGFVIPWTYVTVVNLHTCVRCYVVWPCNTTSMRRTHEPAQKQRYSPLASLSRRFTATRIHLSILEKEAFAIMGTMKRLCWMVDTSDGFDLHTDYHNPIFIFVPLSSLPDLSASAIRKVLRCTVRLSNYNYVCLRIRGEEKIWADILGRCTAPPVIRRLLHLPPIHSM